MGVLDSLSTLLFMLALAGVPPRRLFVMPGVMGEPLPGPLPSPAFFAATSWTCRQPATQRL